MIRPGRYRAAAAASLLIMVAGIACSTSDPTSSTLPTAPPTEPPDPDTVEPLEVPCGATNPGFTDRGTTSVPGGERPDARRLAGIDWISTNECERIVFSFITSRGAPASQIGLSRLEFAPEQGILRIEMPRDVEATAVADALVDGTFVHRAFVVRGRNGSLSVDLHFAGAAPVAARGIIIGAPARLVIDLQLATANEVIGTSPATIARDVVVLSPSPGELSYPLRVRGYARTDGDVVTAGIRSSEPPLDRRVTVAPSVDAWGEFAVTISEGPIGSATLVVSSDRSTDPDVAAIPIVLS